ncbi:ATP-binding cassette domain-containing protein [Spiroplasma clarkii]|uniref:ATP-binding cassette domain-containing protein n=1 Tax=Spiroplasma clarkii TaxID=2139 RepID=UPI0011BAC2A1|nr:ATP-binding cassette domain-containing protein [Spiroplasma clarkii]
MKKENRVLSVRNMEVKFRVRNRILTAIRNVSFDVFNEEVLAIVGESGSGKSVITKTFTGMLEANGWISEGSIVYRPSQATINDDKAFFKEPIDLVNLQKPLISHEVVRFVSKRNKKVIKKLQAEVKKLYQLNPLTVEEDQEKGIELEQHKDLVQQNLTKNNAALTILKTKLGLLKEKEGFTSSNRIFNKIAKLDGEIQYLEDLNKVIANRDYRNDKIEEIELTIEKKFQTHQR